jgi:hypothetical protein
MADRLCIYLRYERLQLLGDGIACLHPETLQEKAVSIRGEDTLISRGIPIHHLLTGITRGLGNLIIYVSLIYG